MKLARDTLLGLVFFGSLVLLVVATVFLSDRVWGPRTRIPVLFETALGLKVGDPVLISGVNNGYVESIQLNTGEGGRPVARTERVRVVLALRNAKPMQLYENYRILIESASALGGHVVNINPGDPEKAIFPIDERAPQALRGEVRQDPFQALGEIAGENRQNLKETIASLRDVVQNIKTGPGIISALIMDPAITQKVKNAIHNIDDLVATAQRGEGTLGKLFKDDKIAKDIESILAKADRGDGLFAKILNDKELGDQVKGIVSDAKEIIATVRRGEGSLGKLLMTSEAHDKLVGLEDKLASLVDKVDRGDGLLGRIVNDKKLGDDLAELLRSAKDIVAKINRGEGSLGRLIQDETLVRNLERTVRSLGRAIEDAREAAPIATFSSVLFGAF